MADHVCPVWIGYFLASPLRKLVQNPRKILGPYVSENMKALDIGSAMGFFSLPLARLVGENGKVICVDLQEKMIRRLEKRARRAGLSDRMEMRVCSRESLGLDDLDGQIDFALAFAVIHEIPDPSKVFREICRALKPNAKFLISEPKGHCTEEAFEIQIAAAEESGFVPVDNPRIRGSRVVLLKKKA